MASLIPLALAAAVYPTLLAGVIVLLARDRPTPLLGAFLAGGVLLAEIPLVGYVVSPDGARVRVTQFRAWLSQHARTVATSAAAAIGVYLTVKGIVGLV
jgi:hypothetical protein